MIQYQICKGFVVSWLFMLVACSGSQVEERIRKPAVAGQFYPANPAELERDVKDRLERARYVDIDGEILGIVAPHAGYVYSADIAVSAYKQVENKDVDIVVVLAPSHRDPFRGATIFPGTAYETPLGEMAIDVEFAQTCQTLCEQFHASEYGHRQEHAVEVQLPFLQTLFPGAKLVPVVLGVLDWQSCHRIGTALATAAKDRNVLFVASTDLYHGNSYQDCKRISGETLSAFAKLKPRDLFQGLEDQTYQACGGNAVTVLQIAAAQLGARRAQLMNRTNSNDVTGQKGGYVVGYGAVVVYVPTTASSSQGRIEYSPLDTTSQHQLLKIARSSIEYFLQHQKIPSYSSDLHELQEKRGVFVTLTKNSRLRGCIGHHESDLPLIELVPQMAVSAAFGDPRFAPLQVDELEEIQIKVSVYLTNVYKIDRIEEFQMGVHGIILHKQGRSATFLPEVPIEAGWESVEEEMTYLCQKAGLPSDGWKDGAEFWVYRTQIFAE